MILSPCIHYINTIFKTDYFAKKLDLVGKVKHQTSMLQLNHEYSTFTIGQTQLKNQLPQHK